MQRRSMTMFAAMTLLAATAAAAPAQETRVAALSAESRPSSGLLEKRVSLELHDVTLAVALTRLHEASEVPISFSPTMLPRGSRVTCSCDGTTLAEALNRVLRDSGFHFLEISDQIVIIKRPSDRPVARLAGLNTTADGRPAGSRPVSPVGLLASRTTALHHGALRAQGQVVGTVVHEDTGEPISAAQVSAEGTELSTLTAQDGRFTLTNVPVGTHTLVAQRIGYETQRAEVTVSEGETTTINLRLAPTALALDEIVVVGYGSQRRQNLTGAVSVVDVDKVLG